MGATWQQWSAASLASGAVLLVLGSLMLPADGADVAAMVDSVAHDGGRWAMAAFALLLASVTLTLGMPSVLLLLGRRRGRLLGLIGVGVWTMGTIGLAAYAALLIFTRAVAPVADLTATEADRIASDRALLVFVTAITVAFVAGELLTALALLRARSVPRWTSLLLLVHGVVAAVAEQLPTAVERAQVLVFGVAVMGVAVRANEARPRRVVAP